jgi:hypothetical protein
MSPAAINTADGGGVDAGSPVDDGIGEGTSDADAAEGDDCDCWGPVDLCGPAHAATIRRTASHACRLTRA